MPRGKTAKHVKILDESRRKTTLSKRKASLYSKAEQLKTLCGVQIFFIIFNQDNNSLSFWPSQEAAQAGMDTFLSFSESEINKKMVVQEKYLQGAINDMNEKIRKLGIKAKEKETELLMNDIAHSKKNVRDLNPEELHDLEEYVEDKLVRLMKRSDELDEEEKRDCQEGGGAGPSGTAGAGPSGTAGAGPSGTAGGGEGAGPSGVGGGEGGTNDDEADPSAAGEGVHQDLNQEPQPSTGPSN